ncbi:MAG: manganese catalase family protein [Geodermatophilaceae bacterium]
MRRPRRVDSHNDLAATRRLTALQRLTDGTAGRARRRRGDAAVHCTERRQHPPLPGWCPGCAAGRRVGNPWSGSSVYNSGNLVLDLLYNLMLESTGRLQKCPSTR